ncbi:MAG: MerR family transcriptional regulator [Gammaproteobacteria bacterium TMED30]|jgi:DNA-binding transcriptional MerR regulator|nr:MAG: MerR family transcriptional regulator [Gammaproteobacteria bacterium TMED30]|tara:strand:- start:688 stop:1077 length:390 start_codon:yes stop_codon:yes gene_type:complete
MSVSVQLYSIRDLSQDFGVTTRTLRFYEEKGLLEPERRGRTRLYTAADRVRLKLILRGKQLGFTLDESAELIAMYDPDSNNVAQLQALIDKIREQRCRVEKQQQHIRLMLKDLKDWEQRSIKALRALVD